MDNFRYNVTDDIEATIAFYLIMLIVKFQGTGYWVRRAKGRSPRFSNVNT